jgi:hypothetical protein
MVDYPLLVFAFSLPALWSVALAGSYFCGRRNLTDDDRADFNVIVATALTLLSLLIGFTFSMAMNRYDQRKNSEAVEANAIGTEYSRAGLMPAVEAAKVRALLRAYVERRILFYTARDARQIQEIDEATARLQEALWLLVQDRAAVQPTPVAALVTSGMNDVLNSQAYTLAAWRNRIPVAAWILMVASAICCNGLVGYTGRQGARLDRLLVVPLIVSISFFLIADIDSPRGGVIRVLPQNLQTVGSSLHSQVSQPSIRVLGTTWI